VWRLRRHGCADDGSLGRGHLGNRDLLDDDRRAVFIFGAFVERSEHDVCFVIAANRGAHSPPNDTAFDTRADHCPCVNLSADDCRIDDRPTDDISRRRHLAGGLRHDRRRDPRRWRRVEDVLPVARGH
jgi:hypothetical protein